MEDYVHLSAHVRSLEVGEVECDVIDGECSEIVYEISREIFREIRSKTNCEVGGECTAAVTNLLNIDVSRISLSDHAKSSLGGPV